MNMRVGEHSVSNRSIRVGALIIAAMMVNCSEPAPAPSASATPSSLPSPSSSVATASSAPTNTDGWLAEEALEVLAKCPWSDESGFPRPCAPLDTLAKNIDMRKPSATTVAAWLADREPRTRGLGLAVARLVDPKTREQLWPSLLQAASTEKVHALDQRFAQDAATLPAGWRSKEREATVEALALSSPTRFRSVFLSFLSAPTGDLPFVSSLLHKSASDPDAAVRLGAIRGAIALDRQGPSGACEMWKAALADGDAEVRHMSRMALVSNPSFTIDDSASGYFGGRVGRLGDPCPDPYADAAIASAKSDREGRKLVVETAVFYGAVLQRQLKSKTKDASDVLGRIALDPKAPVAARVLAARALAAHPETAPLVKSLRDDADPAVAKAAGGE